MLVSAVLLTITSPALAQHAEPAEAHVGINGQAGPAATQRSDPHAGHQMGGMSAEAMKAYCEKMKAEGKKMDGCEMHAGRTAKADPHAGHSMNSK